nr:hypothetical protein CFP56_09426 [Quercus suber]
MDDSTAISTAIVDSINNERIRYATDQPWEITRALQTTLRLIVLGCRSSTLHVMLSSSHYDALPVNIDSCLLYKGHTKPSLQR